VLQRLDDKSAEAKETGQSVGFSPQAVSKALRRAYIAARKQREKALAQLQGMQALGL